MNKNQIKSNVKKQSKTPNYCLHCQQKKGCGALDPQKNYCCPCYRKILEELEWDQLLNEDAQQLLNDYRQRVIICQCWESEKPRVRFISSVGSGWTRCERCEKVISSAGHHGIVKNRNDVRFWGLRECQWRVLCLECLGKKFYKEMEEWQRKKFREYLRRGYK